MTATCRGCDTKWMGARVCHCSSCHNTFSGVAAFDAHQVRGRCKDPSTLGMVPSDQATYTLTWRLPSVDEGAAD